MKKKLKNLNRESGQKLDAIISKLEETNKSTIEVGTAVEKSPVSISSSLIPSFDRIHDMLGEIRDSVLLLRTGGGNPRQVRAPSQFNFSSLLKPLKFVPNLVVDVISAAKAGIGRLQEKILSPFVFVQTKMRDFAETAKSTVSSLVDGARNIAKTLLSNTFGRIGDLFKRKPKQSKDLSVILSNMMQVNTDGFNRVASILEKFINTFHGDELQRIEDQRDQSKILQSIADSLKPENNKVNVQPKEKKQGLLSRLTGGEGGLLGFAVALKGIGVGLGSVVAAPLIGLATGLRALSDPRLLIGIGVITALAGALWVSSKSFKAFDGDINWKNVLYGSGVLAALAGGLALIGPLAPSMLIGATALIAISGAIFIAAKAFKQYTGINWKEVAYGGAALAAFAVGASVLSLAAPAILIGAGVIAALGVALIPFAHAMNIFAKSAPAFTVMLSALIGTLADAAGSIIGAISEAFILVLDGVASTFERLAAVDGGALTSTAGGIAAIGLALAAFGTGAVLAGIGNLVGKLLGGDPVKNFQRFADMGPNLIVAAGAISDLNSAVSRFKSDEMVAMSAGLKTFVSTLSDGFFKRDPMKPLRELADLSTTLYSTDSVSFFNAAGVFFGNLVAFAREATAIERVFDVIEDSPIFNDRKISQLSALVDSLSSLQQNDLNLAPIASTRYEVGRELNAKSIAAQAVQQQQIINVQMPAESYTKQNTNNVSNVTIHQSNHIDATRQMAVLGNKF